MGNLKDIKKGDKVIMRLFTGAFSGVKTVEKVDKTGIYFTTGKGLSKFSNKTGKMVDPAPKNERFANYIEEYDEKIAKAEEKKKSKGVKAAAKKKAAAKAAEEQDDFEEEAPKKKAKKVIKKKKKPEVEEL